MSKLSPWGFKPSPLLSQIYTKPQLGRFNPKAKSRETCGTPFIRASPCLPNALRALALQTGPRQKPQDPKPKLPQTGGKHASGQAQSLPSGVLGLGGLEWGLNNSYIRIVYLRFLHHFSYERHKPQRIFSLHIKGPILLESGSLAARFVIQTSLIWFPV